MDTTILQCMSLGKNLQPWWQYGEQNIATWKTNILTIVYTIILIEIPISGYPNSNFLCKYELGTSDKLDLSTHHKLCRGLVFYPCFLAHVRWAYIGQMWSIHVFFPPILIPNPLQIAVEKPCVLVVLVKPWSSNHYELSTCLTLWCLAYRKKCHATTCGSVSCTKTRHKFGQQCPCHACF